MENKDELGLYVCWCVLNNLMSEYIYNDYSQEIYRLTKNKITGKQFIQLVCKNMLQAEHFNPQGQLFTYYYIIEKRENGLSFFNIDLNNCYKTMEKINLETESRYLYGKLKIYIAKHYLSWINQYSETPIE